LRDGMARDWESLCEHFGISSQQRMTAGTKLAQILLNLIDAGLIEDDIATGSIRLASRWQRIQGALGVSLREISAMSAESVIVQPYFGRPAAPNQPADLFVAMPFDAELQPVYEDHIASVARQLNRTIVRGDDVLSAQTVMADIWNALAASRIVIADCTGQNANVFYEIGIAHTLGKPVILITQNASDIPFDLRQFRYILYDLTPDGLKGLGASLRGTLERELP
jgi:hypothetical protein